MADNLELQAIDDFVEDNAGNLNYPHILIEGVTTEEEVLYFHKKFAEEGKSLPLYLKFDGIHQCIGSFNLTLDNLLVVRSIDKYGLSLVISEEQQLPIDLDDIGSLIKFITLCD